MTAEIGILNRQGVALAADSAVTITTSSKQKVLNSANKLFNLIKGFPVGLMVYGNGDFLGIPWEIIIDDYRKKYVNSNELNTLEEYSQDFFLKLSDKRFYSENAYIERVFGNFNNYITIIIEDTKESISELYPNREITPEEASICFIEKVQLYNKYLSDLEYASNFGNDDIDHIINDKKNQEIVAWCLKENLGFTITKEIMDLTNSMNAFLQCKDVYTNYSGIVIAGYGHNEFFPSLYEYKVEGIINNKLKYKLERKERISSSELDDGKVAEIVPFAQQEMVQTILKGIDPDLNDLLVHNLEAFLDNLTSCAQKVFDCEDCSVKNNNIEKLRKEAFENICDMMKFVNQKSKETYTDPVLNMVSSLPKDELATVAETLINLTSFKRKITMDAETVGGPIDVAIISKSEGFIWMKRKLYFSKDLNQFYFANNNFKGDVYSDLIKQI